MNKYQQALMTMCTRCDNFGSNCANIYRGYKCAEYEDLQELIEMAAPKKVINMSEESYDTIGMCPNCRERSKLC